MTVPFVKLFRTPNNWYVFDVNKSEILPVEGESYDYLQAVFDGEAVWGYELPQELAGLVEQGYLATESVVKEVRHPFVEHMDIFLTRKLNSMTLQLTQDCNLRCKYCIYSESDSERQRSHSRKSMTWEIAKKSLDYLWEHSVDSKRINIGFYGGEPTLEFALMQQAVEYSLAIFAGKELGFTMTTNATMLSDEMIQFLVKHNFNIMVSIDGPKEINDKNRVFPDGSGSFDSVVKSLNRYEELSPAFSEKVMLMMVTDPSNDFDCFNQTLINGSELDNMPMLSTLVDLDFSDSNLIFSDDYKCKNTYHLFLAKMAIINRFPQSEVAPQLRSILGVLRDNYEQNESMRPLQEKDVPSGPCIAGYNRLMVTVDGVLIPCERVSETSESMHIGTIFDGIDIEKAINFTNFGCITEDECKKCWCFRFCLMCAKKADDGSDKLSSVVKLSNCNEAKANAFDNLRAYLLYKEMSVYYPSQIRIV